MRIKPHGKFERFHFIKMLYCKFKINQINKKLDDYYEKSGRYDERREQYHTEVANANQRTD